MRNFLKLPRKNWHSERKLLNEMARPERFELPTFWFVGRSAFSRFFRINKLDGPPSPNFTLRSSPSRSE